MFTRKNHESPLDDAIDEVTRELQTLNADSDEFAKALDHLERLHKVKNEVRSSRHVSPDTMAVVLGNLVGIGMIVGHERAHVVTSKALNFVMKLK